MTPKEFLLQVRKNETLIERKRSRIERMRRLLEYRTPPIDDLPRAGADPAEKSRALARFLALEEEANAEIERMVNHNRRAEYMIDSLPDPLEIKVFYMRYFDGYGWNRIAERMGYSRQWVNEMHGRGLQRLREMYGSDL